MPPILKVLFVFTLFVFGSNLYGQDDREGDFHRFYYSNDDNLFHLASIPTPDGGFCLANVRLAETQTGIEVNVTVTKHNKKGNQDWSQAYTIPDGDYGVNFKNFDLSLIGESLYLVGANLGVTSKTAYFVLELDISNGDVIWSNEISDFESGFILSSTPVAIEGYESDINLFTGHVGVSSIGDILFGINHEAYDDDNQSVKSISYYLQDSLGTALPHVLVDAMTTEDSNYVMTSTIITNGFGDRYSHIKTDRDGNLLMSTQYGLQDVTTIQGLAMASLPDTSIVTTGIFSDPLTSLI